ncbi:hypothetical protein D3C77_608610 [compost metagenome]
MCFLVLGCRTGIHLTDCVDDLCVTRGLVVSSLLESIINMSCHFIQGSVLGHCLDSHPINKPAVDLSGLNSNRAAFDGDRFCGATR